MINKSSSSAETEILLGQFVLVINMDKQLLTADVRPDPGTSCTSDLFI